MSMVAMAPMPKAFTITMNTRETMFVSVEGPCVPIGGCPN